MKTMRTQRKYADYIRHFRDMLETRDIYNSRVASLWCSQRTTNILTNNNINTIGELIKMRPSELQKLAPVGEETLREINASLEALHLELEEDLPNEEIDLGSSVYIPCYQRKSGDWYTGSSEPSMDVYDALDSAQRGLASGQKYGVIQLNTVLVTNIQKKP